LTAEIEKGNYTPRNNFVPPEKLASPVPTPKSRGLMPTRILLADDHQNIRENLRSLLAVQNDFEIVGEAAHGDSVIELARRLCPDVAVMDTSMAGLDGVDATRQIVGLGRGIRVIALSMHSDRLFIGQVLRAGASGYILEDCAADEITVAIRSVLDGCVYLSPEITRVVVDDYVRQIREDVVEASDKLSGREREVLRLMAEGLSTKRIALDLHISPKTVETHRKRIMEKLDIHSVAELTKFAVREGLTTLGD
jgi:RNA polymerase sigma factor (sigma-70 family)